MAYGASLTASLVRAVALFSALFGGSLLCPVLISLSLQRLKTDGDRPVAEWELKLFSMYNLSVLALVAIIQNLLPVELLPLYILPVYLFICRLEMRSIFGISNEEKAHAFCFWHVSHNHIGTIGYFVDTLAVHAARDLKMQSAVNIKTGEQLSISK